MTTYINNTWNKTRRRNYEATNVCFCEAEENPNTANFTETEENIPAGMTHIYTEAGARYYGYL